MVEGRVVNTSPLPADVDGALRDLVTVLAALMGYNEPLKAGETKFCPTCGRVRPIRAFALDRCRRDGLRYQCRGCQSEDRSRNAALKASGACR